MLEQSDWWGDRARRHWSLLICPQGSRFSFSATARLRFMGLEVSSCLLLDDVRVGMNLEPVQTRNKLVGRALGSVLRVHHEQHVREPGPEVGTVRVVMPRGFWSVNVHALGTVEFDHCFARDV